jgi:hypothetical protein
MKIELRFVSGHGPELSQVAFERSVGEVKLSVRGKSANGAGTFQWTAGVKALAELFLGTALFLGKAQRSNDPNSHFSIAGEDGSPAASLDYAISKPTSWIVDMFGRTESGGGVAGLVIKRRNPERKLPGPVELTVAPGLSEPGAITVYLDGHRISTIDGLQALITDLTRCSKESAARTESSLAEALRANLPPQITHQLGEVMLLEPSGITEACSAANDASVAQSLLDHLPAEVLRYSDCKAITGHIREALPRRIRVAAPPTALASLLMFKKLERVFGVEVELSTHFPSTTAIADATFNDDGSSLAVVSWGGLKRFASRGERGTPTPLMLLPRTTFEFLRLGPKNEISTVLAAGDTSGYPRRYFEAWRAACHGDSREVILQGSSFAEIAHHRFAPGDGVIVASPFAALLANQLKLNTQRCDDAVLRIGDNLLVNDGHLTYSEVRAVIPCLRACWFELLENPGEVAALVQELLEDARYTTFIKRVSGLYAADV